MSDFEYTITSDDGDVPVMTDLGRAIVYDPPTPRDGARIIFPAVEGIEALKYEGAVGVTCLVTRTRDGQTEECRGAVTGVEPLSVDLDAVGFH
jgi:hypothetical protein